MTIQSSCVFCWPQIVLHMVYIMAGGWHFPPVDIVLLNMALGPSTHVLRIVVQLETMVNRVVLFIQNVSIPRSCLIPVRMIIADATLVDIPAHMWVKEKKKELMEWCLDRVLPNDPELSDVIWADECSVQLESHHKIAYCKHGELSKMVSRLKHRPKVLSASSTLLSI